MATREPHAQDNDARHPPFQPTASSRGLAPSVSAATPLPVPSTTIKPPLGTSAGDVGDKTVGTAVQITGSHASSLHLEPDAFNFFSWAEDDATDEGDDTERDIVQSVTAVGVTTGFPLFSGDGYGAMAHSSQDDDAMEEDPVMEYDGLSASVLATSMDQDPTAFNAWAFVDRFLQPPSQLDHIGSTAGPAAATTSEQHPEHSSKVSAEQLLRILMKSQQSLQLAWDTRLHRTRAEAAMYAAETRDALHGARVLRQQRQHLLDSVQAHLAASRPLRHAVDSLASSLHATERAQRFIHVCQDINSSLARVEDTREKSPDPLMACAALTAATLSCAHLRALLHSASASTSVKHTSDSSHHLTATKHGAKHVTNAGDTIGTGHRHHTTSTAATDDGSILSPAADLQARRFVQDTMERIGALLPRVKAAVCAALEEACTRLQWPKPVRGLMSNDPDVHERVTTVFLHLTLLQCAVDCLPELSSAHHLHTAAAASSSLKAPAGPGLKHARSDSKTDHRKDSQTSSAELVNGRMTAETHVAQPLDLHHPNRSDLPALLWGMAVMVQPIVLKFEYHFFGSRDTNRTDKPEWYMSFIFAAARDHVAFMNSALQPCIEAAQSELQAEWAVGLGQLVADQLVWGDPLVLAQCVVRAEFIRGLIPVLWRKLERDLSALIVLPDEQANEASSQAHQLRGSSSSSLLALSNAVGSVAKHVRGVSLSGPVPSTNTAGTAEPPAIASGPAPHGRSNSIASTLPPLDGSVTGDSSLTAHSGDGLRSLGASMPSAAPPTAAAVPTAEVEPELPSDARTVAAAGPSSNAAAVQLFRHTVDELLALESKLHGQFGYPPPALWTDVNADHAGTSAGTSRIVAPYLTPMAVFTHSLRAAELRLLDRWLYVETQFALSRLRDVCSLGEAALPWTPLHEPDALSLQLSASLPSSAPAAPALDTTGVLSNVVLSVPPTRSVDSLLTLVKGITPRLLAVPELGVRARFVWEVQVPVLSQYRQYLYQQLIAQRNMLMALASERLDNTGSVPAPKVAAGLAGLTSRSSDRLSPEEAAFRDYGGMLLSVAYCETVLRDWTEAMHYIELHYYTVHATSPPDRSSNGGDVDGGGAAAAAGAQSAQTGDHDSDHSSPRSHHADASVAAADSTKQNEHSMDGTKAQSGSTPTRRRLAPWITSADLHADPHFVNERLAGGVFDAVLSSLESLRTHFVDELVSALVYVFIRRTEPYRKKGHMWAVDVAPAGGSPTPSTTVGNATAEPAVDATDVTVSPELADALSSLHAHVVLLRRYLGPDPALSRACWTRLAASIDRQMFKKLVAAQSFSRAGLQQFGVDMQALFAVFRPYSPAPQNHFRLLRDTLRIMTLAPVDFAKLYHALNRASHAHPTHARNQFHASDAAAAGGVSHAAVSATVRTGEAARSKARKVLARFNIEKFSLRQARDMCDHLALAVLGCKSVSSAGADGLRQELNLPLDDPDSESEEDDRPDSSFVPSDLHTSHRSLKSSAAADSAARKPATRLEPSEDPTVMMGEVSTEVLDSGSRVEAVTDGAQAGDEHRGAERALLAVQLSRHVQSAWDVLASSGAGSFSLSALKGKLSNTFSGSSSKLQQTPSPSTVPAEEQKNLSDAELAIKSSASADHQQPTAAPPSRPIATAVSTTPIMDPVDEEHDHEASDSEPVVDLS